jgi:hypothetical protein
MAKTTLIKGNPIREEYLSRVEIVEKIMRKHKLYEWYYG